jgi:ATP-dependent DNA ligase
MPSGTYAASPYRTAERRLARLLSKPKGKAAQAVASGIVLSEAIEAKGEAMFRHACSMGLEGIVSKRLGSPYVSGRTRAWLKSKNPKNCGLTCKYSLSWKLTCVIASEYAFRPAAITSGCKVSSEKQCL